MSVLTRTPTNVNILQETKYLVSFNRIPDTVFFIQNCNIPGIFSSPASQATPFMDINRAPDKITYEPFIISFIVNEDLSSWVAIHNWLRGLGFPTTFDEYNRLKIENPDTNTNEPQYSQATLTILSALNNPKLRIKFRDIFPVSLTGINLSTVSSADQIPVATATFKYTYFDIESA